MATGDIRRNVDRRKECGTPVPAPSPPDTRPPTLHPGSTFLHVQSKRESINYANQTICDLLRFRLHFARVETVEPTAAKMKRKVEMNSAT